MVVMLSFLPSFILAPLAFVLFCLNLALCGCLVTLGGIIKLLFPIKYVQQNIIYPMHGFYRLWAMNNMLIIKLINDVKITLIGNQNLKKDAWYLLIANHYSWLDIMILADFARTHIPMPKFFLKDSLKKMPFLGMACWALNMPFMKRYSRAYIAKHPELKGKDIETTRKSCEHFKHIPTTIINFVEGTRFTKQKQQDSASSYQYLLPAKAAGIAFTLSALGQQFDKLLNVTLLYPENSGHVMKDTLKGNLKHVIIHIEQIEITPDLRGDYFNDQTFKLSFQDWLNGLWSQKDKLIGKLLNQAV